MFTKLYLKFIQNLDTSSNSGYDMLSRIAEPTALTFKVKFTAYISIRVDFTQGNICQHIQSWETSPLRVATAPM